MANGAGATSEAPGPRRLDSRQSSLFSFTSAVETALAASPTVSQSPSFAHVWHSPVASPTLPRTGDEQLADGQRTPTQDSILPQVVPLPPSPTIATGSSPDQSPTIGASTTTLGLTTASPSLNEKPSWSTLGVSTVFGNNSSWEDLDDEKAKERRVADWDGKGAAGYGDSSFWINGVVAPQPLLQRRSTRIVIGVIGCVLLIVVIAVPAVVVSTRKSSSGSTAALSSSTSLAPSSSITTPTTTTVAPSILPTSIARLAPVPDWVEELYTIGANSTCTFAKLDNSSVPYGANGDNKSNAHYCGDRMASPSVVYWRSNMDIDCDGASGQVGACSSDPSFYPGTQFLINGTTSLDALTTPFVVITDTPTFRPAALGIKGFSVVGVICAGKLTWGVYGDATSFEIIGEASYNIGMTCFGDRVNGDEGHYQADDFTFPGAAVDAYYGQNYTHLASLGNQLIVDRLANISSWS